MARTKAALRREKYRVLVAEDDSEWRVTIVRLVKAIGLACVAVEDGRAATELLQDASQVFHLVITDLRMPRASGWRVVEAARTYRGASFPVIMQTGDAEQPDVCRRAEELRVELIAKRDIHLLLVPAVRNALQLR